MSLTKVLVCAAGGNVGSATVTALQAAGIGLRAGDRDPARLRDRFDGVEVVALDFGDPTTFGPAVEGCDAVFLLRPPPVSRMGPTLNALLDVAAAHGVTHVVFSSVAGAETNKIVPHHRVETHLQAGSVPWTILRPGFFSSNLADAYRRDIVEDDRVFVPARDGRVAFIDPRDIGAVAAAVFVAPGDHVGQAYTLTGPEAVTFDQVAATLTAELGRPIRYEPASVLGYAQHLHGQGLPVAQVLVQTVLHTGLRKGDAETVDPTLSTLLGRPGRSLATYVHDHAARWAPP